MSSLSLQSPDPSPDDEPVMIHELQHFLHQHLLTYDHPGNEEFRRECALCRFSIYDDASYSCKRCNFFLHKRCAEWPRYILNSLHPMHLLELFSRTYPSCSLCNERIYSMGYECSLCNFNLHMDCASETTFDPKDHHGHSFRNSKPTLFTCDACGIDEQGTKCLSYVCCVCQLQVHTSCRNVFPVTVRQRMHRHELKLRYSFEVGFDFSNKLCKICSRNMNNVLCLYQCVDVNGCTGYITHAKCATSSNLLMEDYVDHNTANDDDERKEIDAKQEQAVITHFSHPHSLVLSNVEPDYDVAVCDGCVKPISAPFYTCDSEECKFFLHGQCAILPRTIQSPLHQHQLELSDFPNMDLRYVLIHGYTCQACGVRCNGFGYECEKCGLTYDVGCASFGDTLNHASHKCTLTLISQSPNEETKCIACDSTFSNAYWCDECNFFLDLKCASLPKSIGHDCPTGTIWSIKPIKLRYDCIEHAGGQYYCDMCGETRGKDLWFYHCEDCHDSIHPQCLLGDDRFMYGKFCNIDGHCHTVCVAKKPKTTDPLCDTCGKPCHHSPLVFCPTCNIYMHDDPRCCGMSDSPLGKIKNYCCGNTSLDLHANKHGDRGHINKDDDEKDQEIAIESDVFLEQVNHFSHPHNLIIGGYDPEKLCKEVCDGCGMPISAPFYTCPGKNNNGTCNFFLHKECFELSEQIQHPLHPNHPLFLKSFLDLPWDGQIGFICYGCDAHSNGFAYTCLECKFFLEVGCSLLSDTLAHITHQCTLTLVDKNILHEKGPERKCNMCNSVSCSCKYICDECNFELDLHCASLPKTVMHMCSEHGWRPQHLSYLDYGDNFGSFCVTCGNTLGKNEWYYFCEDCYQSVHTRCASTRNRLLKNRVVYRAYNHFHSLVTPMRGSGILKRCLVCKERLDDHNNLYCVKCDRYLHVKCCRELRRV